jgi:uncharacterized protein (DUF1501 family)
MSHHSNDFTSGSIPAQSRRRFLRQASALVGAASFGAASSGARAQAAGSDYKALVCIFMLGGNDGHNTLVPLAPAAYATYKAGRGALSLPDPNTTLIPIATPGGASYGLNGGLAAIAPQWGQGKLAILANVGMLAQPTTRAQYLAGTAKLPTQLFSHSDQMVQMQAGDANGSGGTGWAGRGADAVQALNGSSRFPASISMNGSALFCAGATVVSASLVPGFDMSADGLAAWPASAATAKSTALAEILALNGGVSVIQAANQVAQDATTLSGLLKGATGGTLATVFPGTSIGQQLQQVAKIIQMRATTGMARQVFFCSIGGFDTHSGQSWQQMDLLRDTANAMAAFYAATQEMGVANQVTAFTESEFGRSLQPSGTGSDHGWGSHHLILGGAVQGGKLYGTMPSLALGGPDDCGNRGVLIPSTSLDQYGATLAKWFGVGPAAMGKVFPNLGKFGTADLGLMG